MPFQKMCSLKSFNHFLNFCNASTRNRSKKYVLNNTFSSSVSICKTLYYKVNGKAECCIVYDTYGREDGWFVVPLYRFTSHRKTAYLEIDFEGSQYVQVAGFEFQPLEEKVELHDKVLEEYQDLVKAASQPLSYESIQELKVLLSIGFYINNYKTWFSLNKNGEHCEMLSIAHCLISREDGYSIYYNDHYSRFPSWIYKTNYKGFKVHIKTQFLTPSIRYTVNLVFHKGYYHKQKYVALRYKLEGETETSIVYLANETKDNRSFIAELYQFTSDGRIFDLEVVILDHDFDFAVEGILFQPLEKVEHKQVLEDEELSNDNLHWTMNEDLGKQLLKWFHVDRGQEGYAVDNNGKKSLLFSARSVIRSDKLYFNFSPESRFQEVAVITASNFKIVKEIKYDLVSPETTYACYLVYKSAEDQPVLKIINSKDYKSDYHPFIYLVSPPDTPIIGQKLDQNTHNPLNRPKLDYVPRQRNDGWMEVRICEFKPRTTEIIDIDIDIVLLTRYYDSLRELIIQSIQLRPIVVHSV